MFRSKRGDLEMSFAWLFAIIVGAFILFLTIYSVTRVINTGDQATNAKAGKEISVLLNPLETSVEAGKSVLLTMPVETRINNQCDKSGTFGLQRISLAQKSFGRWVGTDVDTVFRNKYVFSEKTVEGKEFFLFVKPFYMPFKVSDLVYLMPATTNYCFVNPSRDVENEIKEIDQSNLKVGNCSSAGVRVCFDGDSGINCDVKVDETAKTVEKNGEMVYYETDSLMYAAIFSDKATYECGVSRLMSKTKETARLYTDKQALLSAQECFADVNLFSLEGATASYRNSTDLSAVSDTAQVVDAENDIAECELW